MSVGPGMAPTWITSQILSVTSTSAEFTSPMLVDQVYRLTATTDIWFRVVATGTTAGAAAGSHLLKAFDSVVLTPLDGTTKYVAAIRNSADGTANLSLLGNVS